METTDESNLPMTILTFDDDLVLGSCSEYADQEGNHCSDDEAIEQCNIIQGIKSNLQLQSFFLVPHKAMEG